MSTSLRNNLSLVVLYASSLVVLLAFCAWMYAARPDGNATGYPAVETSLRVSVDGDLSGSIAESVALRPDWSNDATDFDYRRLESICLGIGSSTDQDLGLYSLGLADGPDIETRSQVWARYDLVSGCRSSSIVSWETPGDNATVLLSGVSDYLDRHTDGWSGLGVDGAGDWYVQSSRPSAVAVFGGETKARGSVIVSLPGTAASAPWSELVHTNADAIDPRGGLNWTWTSGDPATVGAAWFVGGDGYSEGDSRIAVGLIAWAIAMVLFSSVLAGADRRTAAMAIWRDRHDSVWGLYRNDDRARR